MKKTLFVTLALAAAFSCTKTPDPSITLSTDTVNVNFEGAERVAVEITANRDWTITTDGATWYTVEPLSGSGNATIYVTVQPLETVATRAAELVLTAESATTRLSIVQGLPDVADVQSGSFVIEEVFFAGYLLEDGQSADGTDGDQYIKITNNTDNLLYADGLLLTLGCESSQISSTGSYWSWPETPDAIGVDDIYQIPGNGTDYPVLPGKSLVIALNAQNFAEENGAGLDLSKADFEFYDGENEYFPDSNNPDVADLNIWVKSSFTVTILHARGYFSVALAKVPDTYNAESFMEEFAWEGEQTFYLFGEPFRTRDIPSGNYLIKNEWVVDGVNLGVEQDLGRLWFNASIDSGYTGCGKIDSDPDRYGKSALRKNNGGKLADTNNSTNDFTRDATPTLAK